MRRMNKKQLVNQLNSQKGVTGADVVIALLIILTAVGVIAMVYVNLVIGSRDVDRKTGATRIATNILENMSQVYYDEIEANLEINGNANKVDNRYDVSTDKIFNTSIPNGYHVQIRMEEIGSYDLVKKATVAVQYKTDGQEKEVAFEKVFERENVRECNSPNFSQVYIRQMIEESENYEMYSEQAKNAAGIKIICPIQYNHETKTYQIVTNTDELWYSYSNKQWARVLVMEAEAIETPITNEMLKGENSYVWIPRFGIENGKDLFGGTCFKYKTTDYAIFNSYYKQAEESFFYNYIDSTLEWSVNRGFDEPGKVGRWCPYRELKERGTVAYTLNESQYGPMRER